MLKLKGKPRKPSEFGMTVGICFTAALAVMAGATLRSGPRQPTRLPSAGRQGQA